MGRSAESIERRRIYDREKKKHLYATDPEYRARALEKSKIRNARNAEARKAEAKRRYHLNKEKRNKQRAEWSRRNRERQLEYQRNYYRENAERLRKLIYESRSRRDPSRGLYGELQRFEKGDLSFDQLIESIGARIIRLDERAKSLAAGDDDQTLRSGARADGGDVRSPDCRVNENETGTTKVLKEAGEIK